MIDNLLKILQNENYSLFVTILAVVFFIYGLYQKVKFICLEKASEMVADAESHSELSGKEKFSLVVLWIDEYLPAIFRTALFQNLLNKIIEFAYKTSFGYMKKYVKRKTGYDISELIEQINSESDK